MPPLLKAEHVNPFLDATRDVFSIMMGLDIRRTNLTLKAPGSGNSDVSGIIGLAGQFSGAIVLNLKWDAVTGIVSRFLGEEITDPHEYEVLDAVGELTNIVAGSAKSKLVDAGMSVQIGLPTIIVGEDHHVSRPPGVPTVCIHWTSEAGDFVLEVCLKPTPD